MRTDTLTAAPGGLGLMAAGETFSFEVPPELEAGEPPEARGLARDEVRLMVSYRADDRVVHARFQDLGQFLEPGDTLVINTSGTLNAALVAVHADGTPLELHLSTRLSSDAWLVELRTKDGQTTKPYSAVRAGDGLHLPGGARATLRAPHPRDARGDAGQPTRLWIAALCLPMALEEYLAKYGFPIRYDYVRHPWPLSYYQTVYATEVGSAEMPSAGRAFTPELITRLVARGVLFAPLLLHTGVASLEHHEPPYAEIYRVSAETARAVNVAREGGKRVVAVGTTVVRALETVSDAQGRAHPGGGWTELVITPERGLRAVDALLTGLHEPRSTHLALLAALAGREHLRVTYAEALRAGYLWHEFGDLHLILP